MEEEEGIRTIHRGRFWADCKFRGPAVRSSILCKTVSNQLDFIISWSSSIWRATSTAMWSSISSLSQASPSHKWSEHSGLFATNSSVRSHAIYLFQRLSDQKSGKNMRSRSQCHGHGPSRNILPHFVLHYSNRSAWLFRENTATLREAMTLFNWPTIIGEFLQEQRAYIRKVRLEPLPLKSFPSRSQTITNSNFPSYRYHVCCQSSIHSSSRWCDHHPQQDWVYCHIRSP